MALPRELNNSLQARLHEYGLSFRDLPELPGMIDHRLTGTWSAETFAHGLERILRFKLTAIPRKGARGGYDWIGTPDDRLRFLVGEIVTIVDCAASVPGPGGGTPKK